MDSITADLMQINLSLIRAKQALGSIDIKCLERGDKVLARQLGATYDAIISAYTIAALLLRSLPQSNIVGDRI